MTTVPSVDAFPIPLSRRSLIVLGAALGLAVLWHLCLPTFFYRNCAVFLEGPLPAVAGLAIALWRHQAAPAWRQAWAALAWALAVTSLVILVLGTLIFGPWDAVRGLWAQITSGFHLPFAALLELAGNPRFVYGFWSGLKPFLLWGGLSYAGWQLLRGDLREHLGRWSGGWRDERAFSRDQRAQMAAYRKTYLIAVESGTPRPAVPDGLVTAGGGTTHRLATSYWLLRIVLAVVAFAGVSGGLLSLLGGGLEQSMLAVFWRGLLGG